MNDGSANGRRGRRRSVLAVLVLAVVVFVPAGVGARSAFTVSSSIASGQKLSGKLVWSATVAGVPEGDVSSVVFEIDGVAKWTEKQSPYTYGGNGQQLDTTTLGNGSHTFTVVGTAKGNLTATTSAAATVANPPQNTAPPAISGTAVERGRLGASNGSWSGTGPFHFADQWLRCDANGNSCGPIGGATGSTYTLAAADVGHRIRIQVTASNDAGGTTATSSATSTVQAAGAAPVNRSRPSISGSTRDGSLLSSSRGGWRNGPTAFAYQWLRCDATGANCGPIAGATGGQYTLTTADVGRRLRVAVTAMNSFGHATATSFSSRIVGATGTAPANTALPSISGTPRDGSTLSVATGNWSGSPAPAFGFQWQRCDAGGAACVDIAGATGNRYTLGPADAAHTLRTRVTALNSRGSASATTQASGLVMPARPGGAAVSVGQVSLPDLLLIDQLSFQPNPLRSRETPLVARFHISDLRGFSVAGAYVYAIGLPYGWVRNAAEAVSDGSGWATVVLRPTRALPRRRAALVLFVRARKPGDNPLSGVSTRRLVQVGIR